MATITIKDGLRYVIRSEQVINGQVVTEKAIREDMAKFGISEVQIEDRKDDRYYYISEPAAFPYIVQEPKPLEQVVPGIWDQIKAHRDSLTQTGGAKVDTKWFHSDTHSKLQQLSLLTLGANIPAGLEWKTMDGTFVPMTSELAQQVFVAQVAQEQAIFTMAETKRLALAQLETIEEVIAFDWRTGWPEVYTEAV